MHLLVFGANGPTGRVVVRRALEVGHRVAAVTRKPDDFPLSSPELEVVEADVTDADAVDRAMASGPDAVISTYGVPFSRREITVYSEGMTHVVASMATYGVARLVCVTSTTVAPGDAPGDSLAWRKVTHPLLRRVLGRTLYDDMERMEQIVTGTSLDWTVVRPAGLFDADEPGDYALGPGRLEGHLTSRADLADGLLAEAVQSLHPRQVVELVSRSKPEGSMRTMLKEALGGRS